VAVARELGIHDTTLGNCVRAYKEKRVGDEAPVSLSDRARLRELERENRELQQKVAFLEKVSAYFASGQR
jgi:transposase-like protein